VTVLDASAVLALIHNEPGADRVADALAGGVLATINLAEVVGKLVDAQVDATRVRSLLTSAGVNI
jgi:ribonuclease VapC